MNAWQQHYHPATPQPWVGRPDSPSGGRFFQIIQCCDLRQGLPEPPLAAQQRCFALLGFACDEGIKRNLGRPGARQGPAALRQALTGMPHHFTQPLALYDVGDIVCEQHDLEAAQTSLGEVVAQLLSHGFHPLVIGGGHEMAWGHYQGIAKALPQSHLGIINFDAHFDLRPLDAQGRGSSGTPFLQIAQHRQQQQLDFDYTCIGIQKAANTPELFATAQQLGVHYILAEELNLNNGQHGYATVDDAVHQDAQLYITLCLDAFAACFAPGVSAPQVVGLTPWQVIAILRYLVKSRKVISLDIAELSPPYDSQGITAKLAALLLFEYLHASVP